MFNSTAQPDSAIKRLADGVLAGMIEILRDRDLVPADPSDAWCDRLAAAAKAGMKSNLDEVLDEWADAVEAPGLSDGWLHHMVTTQAAGIALEALIAGEFIPAPSEPEQAEDAHLEAAYEDQFYIADDGAMGW
jgi:hypothetical protein